MTLIPVDRTIYPDLFCGRSLAVFWFFLYSRHHDLSYDAKQAEAVGELCEIADLKRIPGLIFIGKDGYPASVKLFGITPDCRVLNLKALHDQLLKMLYPVPGRLLFPGVIRISFRYRIPQEIKEISPFHSKDPERRALLHHPDLLRACKALYAEFHISRGELSKGSVIIDTDHPVIFPVFIFLKRDIAGMTVDIPADPVRNLYIA